MEEKATDSGAGRSRFRVVAKTQAEEDSYDFVKERTGVNAAGVTGSVAHLVKGALGAGILSGHVAYMKAGLGIALPGTFICGAYISYCLHTLVKATQVLYRRTRVPILTYSDVGEASVACFPNPKVARFSKAFRYYIDTVISIDLFGSCACYQIIIAKSLKQLVENTARTQIQGIPGYPSIRIYLLCMILPVVLICLIRHLTYLAPFSIVANIIIVFCIGMGIYYAFIFNPTFKDLVFVTSTYEFFEFLGMSVFSMSCAGVVLPIENNMAEPQKFPLALGLGMAIIMVFTYLSSFFGYVAFKEESESPITCNFPMDILPKILKGLIIVMIYVTHALNYWVPFNICFYYLKKRHDESKQFKWELIYRATFVIIIGFVATAFPAVENLMGFIGSLCLSNMALIWPNVIALLVFWERPGPGKFYWRLILHCFLLIVALFILVVASTINFHSLVSVFIK